VVKEWVKIGLTEIKKSLICEFGHFAVCGCRNIFEPDEGN
jgi:hypothetical protein